MTATADSPSGARAASSAGSHSFDVVDSEILVEAPILALRRDQVRMPGGRVAAREIVEHFGAVAVVARDGAGRICLLRQWRQSAGERLVELPAGILDVAGEDPLVAARRELAEEAGVAAERWSLLTDIYTSPGFAEESVRVYLAEGLSSVDRPAPEDEEADMTESWVDLAEAADMVLRGEVTNSIAVAGILAAHVTLSEGRDRREAGVPFTIRPTRLAARRAEALGPDADLKQVPQRESEQGADADGRR